jgi:hypothetical protein
MKYVKQEKYVFSSENASISGFYFFSFPIFVRNLRNFEETLGTDIFLIHILSVLWTSARSSRCRISVRYNPGKR